MDWKVTGALLLILVSAEARNCVDSTGRVVAPGEEFFDGCNYCKCAPIGMPSICTMRICPDNKQLLPPMFTNNAGGNGTASTFPASFNPMYQALLGNSGLSSIFQPIFRQARLVWLKFRPGMDGVGGTLVPTTGPVNPMARFPAGGMGATRMGATGMRGMAAGGAGAGRMGAGATMGAGAAGTGAMGVGRMGAGGIGAGGMAGMQNNMRSQRAMEMMRRLAMQNRGGMGGAQLGAGMQGAQLGAGMSGAQLGAGMSGAQLGGGQLPINVPLLMLLGGKNGETGISKDFATSSTMRQLLAAMLANNQMNQMAAQGQMGGQLGMGVGGQGQMGALGLGGQAGLGPFGAQLGMGGPGALGMGDLGMLAQLDPSLAMGGLGAGPALSVPVWQTKIPGAPTSPMDGLMEAMLIRQLLNRGGGGEGGAGGGGEGGGAAGGGEGGAAGGGEGGGTAGGGEGEGGAAQQNRGLQGLNLGLGPRLGLQPRQRPVVD